MNNVVHRDRRVGQNEYTGAQLVGVEFHNCDFSQADLSDAQFVDCRFYDHEREQGCSFRGASLARATFRKCDLTLCNFNFAKALGVEMSGWLDGHGRTGRRAAKVGIGRKR